MLSQTPVNIKATQDSYHMFGDKEIVNIIIKEKYYLKNYEQQAAAEAKKGCFVLDKILYYI